MRHARLVLAALPIMLTVAGCVSVSPAGSSAPSASLAPTPAASPTPTRPVATPAASETPAPLTPSPSVAPSDPVTPVPSSAPSGDPASPAPDSELVFDDSFDTDASGWGVVEVEGFGSIEWFDGALAFSAETVQGSLQSTKPAPGGVLWEELDGSADFTPVDGADSIMGIYCSPGDGTLIGALVSVDGTWLIVAGTQDAVTVVDRGVVPEGSMALGQTSTVAFQCSGAKSDLLPMMRLAIGAEIVATTEVPLEYASMSTFSTVGLWVEPVTPPMLVGVDEVQVAGRHQPRREELGPPPTSAP